MKKHGVLACSADMGSKERVWPEFGRDAEMKYALWLYNVPGISGAKSRGWLEQGITAKSIYGKQEEELVKMGIGEREAGAIGDFRKKQDPEELLLRLAEGGIGFVSLEQKEYPPRLRMIPDPPYGIYYKGRLPSDERSVAIVGARGRSEYGRQVARRLGEELARSGFSVVSGLARGIDADGQRGALDGKGRTFAVLGCGVDICYPAGNRYLYDQILESGGGILSEYHPTQPPLARLFPSRNRLIAGLSECVAVVEAKKRSGSLITADYAMEQGRDVYAVPGRITDVLSEGCNDLISQGAGILTNTERFVRELEGFREESVVQLDFRKFLLEKEEQLVYSLLDFCPKGVGVLLEQSGLSLNDLLDILGRLQAREYAEEAIPNYYVRRV